ncbi:MAG TPA: HepT-like ribonuclease domain-containing protein [archaeon]|nr:HepT-like ribonuclease domain-containing protein [archaeon]
MKFDKERIGVIISDLERFFKDLESLEIKSDKDLDDRRNFYSTSMLVFAAINRLIDLGEEIVLAKSFGTPSTYKDTFRLLQINKIIDRDLEKKLGYLIEYRNILSHEYSTFTKGQLYNLIKEMPSIKKFATLVKKLLS